jgi:hypothetical protein
MHFLAHQEPITWAFVLALLMALAWKLGARLGRCKSTETELTRFDDGALALFGLLLAFCFSGAATRYEARKSLVLDEATAIGDFAGTVSLLAEPQRALLLRELHVYVAQRIAFGSIRLHDPALPGLLRDSRATQARIAALVAQAVHAGNTQSVHEPLVDTLNALTTAYQNRLQGLRDHMPDAILVMLVVFAVFSSFTMGRAPSGKTAGSALAYAALVALVFGVILDLETPRRGYLRVSQQPMHDLADNLPQ